METQESNDLPKTELWKPFEIVRYCDNDVYELAIVLLRQKHAKRDAQNTGNSLTVRLFRAFHIISLGKIQKY